MKDYDYEKENPKVCPVCAAIIDYHTCGFYHDEVLNIWICRDHTLAEIEKVVKLQDKKLIKFIQSCEAHLVCPKCAGKPLIEPEDDTLFELRECSICGGLTAPELGAIILCGDEDGKPGPQAPTN